jgi:hypothetical protein
MPTIPTGEMEAALRRLYLLWLRELEYSDGTMAAKIKRFEEQSKKLISNYGGRVASLGAQLDFPAPKKLELSPYADKVYDEMQLAAVRAGIMTGISSKEAAQAMFRAGMDKSYNRLERLARTETTNAYWKNAFDSVADLPAIVMIWGSEESKRTCDWCRERDGLVMDSPNLRDHPNGRCTPIPTLRSMVVYRGSISPDNQIYNDPAWAKAETYKIGMEKPQEVQVELDAAAAPNIEGKDYRNMTNADKIEAAKIMYGTDSAQYAAAKKKFGTPPRAKATPKAKPSPERPFSDVEMSKGFSNAEGARRKLNADIRDTSGEYNARKGWDADSAKARNRYIGADFETINEWLRNTTPILPGEADWWSAPKKYTEDLGRALTKNKLTEDIIVGRGIAPTKYFNPGALKAGDNFADPAFLSTTTDMSVAMDFMNGSDLGEGWLFMIKAPKGTSAVPGLGEESEIIFKPGQKQRVVFVDHANRTVYTEMIK